MRQQAKCFAYGALLLVAGFHFNKNAAARPAPAVAHPPAIAAHAASSGDEAAAAKYNCCIKTACSFCKHNPGQTGGAPAGQCRCFEGIQSGKAACAECHGGWEVGQGIVPGKTRKDVRKMKMTKP